MCVCDFALVEVLLLPILQILFDVIWSSIGLFEAFICSCQSPFEKPQSSIGYADLPFIQILSESFRFFSWNLVKFR